MTKAISSIRAKAPLVVKKRKVTNIRFDGKPFSKRDNIELDMTKQGLSDVKFLLRQITYLETQAQIKIDNLPTRMAVDSRENKPLHAVERRTEVTYGNELDINMMKAVERNVRSSASMNAVTPSGKSLSSAGSWEWRYVEKPGKGELGVVIRNYNIKSVAIGSYLIYRPTVTIVGIENMFAARSDAGKPLLGPGRSGGVGFMAKGISKIKRSRLLKNYTIRIVFTQRFAIPGEQYSHGTPVVIVKAKRNRRYAKVRI